MILSTFHQKWLISQCWWGDPPVLSCGVAAVLTLFYNFFCMIYRKCDILLPAWICVYLHQTFSMVYESALLLFFFAAINFFSCHEFIDSIFSSVYLNWLPVLVITTTNYFVTISTVCMFLICFSVWFIIVCCLVQMCESFLLLFQNQNSTCKNSFDVDVLFCDIWAC